MPPEDDRPILDHAGPMRKSRRLFRTIIFSAAGILAILLVICIFIPRPISYEILSRSRSASKLREIGEAILLYCNEHGDAYPDSFSTLLLQGDITSDVFVSPGSSDIPAAGPTTQAIADQLTAGGHLSYVYLGKGLTNKTATSNTIVAHEKLLISGNGANVLFGDGHVEWMDAKQVTKIVAQAASGKFPVTKPSN